MDMAYLALCGVSLVALGAALRLVGARHHLETTMEASIERYESEIRYAIAELGIIYWDEECECWRENPNHE